MAGAKISNCPAKDMKSIEMEDTPLATILLPKDVIYQGRISKSTAHDSNGLVIYADGSFYKGNIKYGVIQGKGLYRFAD